MKTDPTDIRVRHFEWKNATFGDIKRRPHSQLTSHTDSRLPAPSRCLSAESCPHVQTSPAASLWPGFQCSRSKWSGTASLPSPCCFRGRHSCAECVRVATGCSKQMSLWEDTRQENLFSGFHTFLSNTCSAHLAHCLAWKKAFICWKVKVYFWLWYGAFLIQFLWQVTTQKNTLKGIIYSTNRQVLLYDTLLPTDKIIFVYIWTHQL